MSDLTDAIKTAGGATGKIILEFDHRYKFWAWWIVGAVIAYTAGLVAINLSNHWMLMVWWPGFAWLLIATLAMWRGDMWNKPLAPLVTAATVLSAVTFAFILVLNQIPGYWSMYGIFVPTLLIAAAVAINGGPRPILVAFLTAVGAATALAQLKNPAKGAVEFVSWFWLNVTTLAIFSALLIGMYLMLIPFGWIMGVLGGLLFWVSVTAILGLIVGSAYTKQKPDNWLWTSTVWLGAGLLIKLACILVGIGAFNLGSAAVDSVSNSSLLGGTAAQQVTENAAGVPNSAPSVINLPACNGNSSWTTIAGIQGFMPYGGLMHTGRVRVQYTTDGLNWIEGAPIPGAASRWCASTDHYAGSNMSVTWNQ